MGDIPSTCPSADAVRMFFQLTARIFSSSVVLILAAGGERIGGGGLSIGSEYSLGSTETNLRRESLVIVAALSVKHMYHEMFPRGFFS